MKQSLLTMFFLIITKVAFACDCESQGNFLIVAQKIPFIALIKVNKYLTYNENDTPKSMEIKIIRVLKGKEIRKSVVVWGDNGNLCRPYISIFNLEKFYIIAFNKAFENKKDYSVSNCGDYWLTFNNDTKIAHGAISNSMRTISVKELSLKLK